MTLIELVEKLTNICIQQAKIIKKQAFALEQLNAVIDEEGTQAVLNELEGITNVGKVGKTERLGSGTGSMD